MFNRNPAEYFTVISSLLFSVGITPWPVTLILCIADWMFTRPFVFLFLNVGVPQLLPPPVSVTQSLIYQSFHTFKGRTIQSSLITWLCQGGETFDITGHWSGWWQAGQDMGQLWCDYLLHVHPVTTPYSRCLNVYFRCISIKLCFKTLRVTHNGLVCGYAGEVYASAVYWTVNAVLWSACA